MIKLTHWNEKQEGITNIYLDDSKSYRICKSVMGNSRVFGTIIYTWNKLYQCSVGNNGISVKETKEQIDALIFNESFDKLLLF